jgi:hypothetical protein
VTSSVIRTIIALRRCPLTNITFLLLALLILVSVFSPVGEPDGPVARLVFPDPCFLGTLVVGHWDMNVRLVVEIRRERRRRRRKKERELEVRDVVCRDGEGYESGTRVELYTVS